MMVNKKKYHVSNSKLTITKLKYILYIPDIVLF